jgi:hypothetical protein
MTPLMLNHSQVNKVSNKKETLHNNTYNNLIFFFFFLPLADHSSPQEMELDLPTPRPLTSKIVPHDSNDIDFRLDFMIEFFKRGSLAVNGEAKSHPDSSASTQDGVVPSEKKASFLSSLLFFLVLLESLSHILFFSSEKETSL